MTTFHHGNVIIDGAFREEEPESALQGAAITNALNQTQTNIQEWNGAHTHNDILMAQAEDNREMSSGPLLNQESRVNGFDLSKVDCEDNAPSDSEQVFNRNSISNSPTRNRKPI